MNRIVLVGNGYDLAFNLKTSYKDFILDYIKSQLIELFEGEKRIVSDKLCTFSQGTDNYPIDKIRAIDNIEEIIKSPMVKYNNTNIKVQRFYYSLEIKSELLRNIISQLEWANIEGAYFNEILKLIQKRNRNLPESKTIYDWSIVDKEVDKLNEEFEYLTDLITEFLKKTDSILDEVFDEERVVKLHKRLRKLLSEKDFIRIFDIKNDTKSRDINRDTRFINFNYTKKLQYDLDKIAYPHHKVYQIHGSLNHKDSIIFGYGDYTHSEFSSIKQINRPEYLRNFKNYKYQSSSDYNELILFLNSMPYCVIVLGHSLGTSDRFLLRQVFNHSNCKAIRIFHRSSKASFSSKLINLSQHFDNEEDWMNKMIAFDELDVI